MLGYRKPMSFLPPLFLFSLTAAAHVLAVVSAHHGLSDEPNGFVKLDLLHRHHPDVSRKLHGHAKPETLIDRLRDLHDQDHKRHRLISLSLLRDQHVNHQTPNTRRLDLQTGESLASSAPIGLKMHSGADYGNGLYFVHLQVGTPPQKFMLVADTGSELTWMKCRYRRCVGNCTNHKNHLHRRTGFAKAFLANRSSSFKTVDCSSHMCKSSFAKLFSVMKCPTPTSPCVYDYRYLDGSSALGIFANETITVGLTNGKQAQLHDALIGCTESIPGTGFGGSDGVLALAHGAYSFTLKAAELSSGGFSYCLVDHLSKKNETNYFIFGKPRASPESKYNMTYTQLFLGGPYYNFYGVDLEGISVDGVKLNIPPRVWDIKAGGGTIIDSGTSLTLLVAPAYKELMEALTPPLSKFQRITLSPFEFCFNTTGFSYSMAPKVRFHFGDGGVFEPPPKSYILPAATDTNCIGFQPMGFPSTNIIGNILQQNHLWEFDLVRKKVGFAPSSCL